MTAVTQPSFTGGELAPPLWGRVDIAKYQNSLALCSNFVAQAYGGVKNRQGTRFAALAKSGAAIVRLVPFVYSAEQSYVLEIGAIAGGDQYMRVFSRGRQVVYGDNVPPGSSIGDPVEILNLPWLPAEIFNLKFSQSADVLTVTHPLHQPVQIKRYFHDKWGAVAFTAEKGPFESINTDKSVFVSSDGAEGAVTLTASTTIFNPWDSGKLFKMEAKDYGIPWETNKAVALGDIRRSDGKYYQAVAAGTTGTLRPTHDSDKWSDGAVEWEFLHPGFGIAKLGEIQATSSTADATVVMRIPDALVTASGTSNVTANITAIAEDPSGKTTLTLDSTAGLPTGTTFDATITIRFNNSTGGETIVNRGVEADITGSTTALVSLFWFDLLELGYDGDFVDGTLHYRPDGSTPDTYRWAFGAWGGGETIPSWPSCSTYFQQRQCFAGSLAQPQAVWMSRTNSYADFGDSNPIADDDSLSFTLASSQIDSVRSLLALDKLVMFTQGGNWVTSSGQSDVITPSNIAAKLQNYYGSSSLAPLGVGSTALYYGKGRTIRDMGYDFASDTYTGNDLSVAVPHLMENHSVVDWAFQAAPFPCVWSVRDDGMLLGMTYLREQNINGWHRHDLSGTVESVAVINECDEDHVYVIVKRTINGATKKAVEYMANRTDDFYEQFFVDCGSTYDGRNVNGGTITVTGGTTWTSADTLTLTYTGNANIATLFALGSGDVGDHIVLQAADGTLYRISISSVSTTSVALGNLVTGTLPVDLRATATDSWAFARDSFSGLSHLEGKTVAVYSDGAALAQRAVSSGVVSLAGEPGFVVHIGLPITAKLQTLAMTIPGPTGPGLEQQKLSTSVKMMLENSRSCYVGPDESNLVNAVIGSNTNQASGGVQTGILVANVPASWNRSGQMIVKHTAPTALSILTIIPDVITAAMGAKS